MNWGFGFRTSVLQNTVAEFTREAIGMALYKIVNGKLKPVPTETEGFVQTASMGEIGAFEAKIEDGQNKIDRKYSMMGLCGLPDCKLFGRTENMLRPVDFRRSKGVLGRLLWRVVSEEVR